MIIHQLKLLNFGIYEGEQVFNLTPEPYNGYNRPIILLRGKNGAGKTTLVEAIRLCLNGSLVLGNRVSRSVYEDYLAKHIHTPKNSNNHPTSAKVVLLLDYVSEGRKKTYRVEREWEVIKDKVKEGVHIWEDDEVLTDLENREQRDGFLRELVPPGVADLFFFDGEKLHTLADSNTSSDLLADTVNALLGLNLVEQLQKDLDIYLSRQRSNHSQASLQDQLYELTQEISSLERKCLDLQSDQRVNAEAIAKKRRAIAEQEQRIASEGSWFAERLEDLKTTRQRLEVEIELLRRRAQELANGLLPFAITPQMSLSVAERLQLEAEYEQGVAAQQVLASQLEQVSAELTSPEFWIEIGISIDEATKRKVLSRVESALKQTIQLPDIAPEDVIHRVSDQDRQTLLNWIGQSRTQVPQEFCQTISQLNTLEEKLQQVGQEMQLVPADETLGPLVQELHLYNQELGALQKMAEGLAEQFRRLEYELEQMGYQRQRLRQQIVEQEQNNWRVQLVDKVQLVLEEYAEDLNREKVALLEKRLAARFNDLCHKEDLVDTLRIDSKTFEITLYRQQQSLALEQLSAGERQLLALAIMWALGEVSGVPMPVIIDAPLGRLDSDHRFSMVQNYFPRVSHQVILLVTDAEVDDQVLSRLKPAISHIYYLDYDPSQGKTVVHEDTSVNTSSLEKVVVS
jgi:DNA sulfur modification protein DndD